MASDFSVAKITIHLNIPLLMFPDNLTAESCPQVDQLSMEQPHHLSIKDIGIILERLSSKASIL
jgi:hypothetical protein